MILKDLNKIKYVTLVLLVLVLTILNNCDKTNSDPNKLYSNSFESKNDIIDWDGSALSDIPAPLCGDSSLFVSGGCVIPHVTYKLGPFEKEYTLIISFWAKALINSGSVRVRLNSYDEKVYDSGINVQIQNTEWEYYESSQTLTCPANQEIILEFSSGGFAPGGMLIDKFEIKEIIK